MKRFPCSDLTLLVLPVALATFVLVARPASAGEISCETFNDCTAGICLENGTCEESPSNEGGPCETANPCTQGTCSNGICNESNRDNGTACEPFDACMEQDGTCSNGTCAGPPIGNGEPCRADVLGPCFTGTCTVFGPVTVCIPQPKCGEFTNVCEFNCNPFNGACEASPTHICDTACTTATCVPGENLSHTCEDPVNRPDDTACEDGSTCTTNDTCEAGDCIGGQGTTEPVCGDNVVDAPEECDDGDDAFAAGEYCSAACTLIACGKPTNSTGELPKSSDAQFTLRSSVHLVACDLSVCDVNHSGGVTAGDALLVLKKAVGSPATLNCPEHAGGGGA